MPPHAPSSPAPSDLDRRLLRAAAAFGAEPDLPDLLRILTDALAPWPGVVLVALGLHDARHRTLVLHAVAGPATTAPGTPITTHPHGDEFPLADTEAEVFLRSTQAYASSDLSGRHELALEHCFHAVGVRRYVAVPLTGWHGSRLRDHASDAPRPLVGVLYAGFALDAERQGLDDPARADRRVIDYLERLGTILTPAFENFRTRERLTKGDARRSTLIELSRAINTSLELDTVLTTAHEAISQIEGHQASIIALLEPLTRPSGLEPNRTHFRAYWRQSVPTQARGRAPTGSELLPVANSALAWVLTNQKTYESDDLERKTAFDLDIAFQQVGVRRYAVAPMFVRGRVIGGFFFGTADPHPALTTDVWLYENIALQLGLAVDNAVQFEELKRLTDRLAEQNVYLREEIATEHNVEGMIGRSPSIRRVFDAVARVADTDTTVLILGETGVGKELVARALHARSPRARHPLVKMNCAAIPENLVESELFGHEKGAFTSATSRRLGRFELAREGTIFLDEVGELPLAIQAKLLRVLQDGEFERVGGAETLTTDARILAATNRDLREAVERGTIRSDLYYRLNVFPIHVPPLAERRDDIPLLVDAFIAQFNRRMGKKVTSIDARSLDYVCRRDWPGNIRELRHVIERAMILCDGPVLTIEPTESFSQVRSPAPSVHSAAPLAAPALSAYAPPPDLSTLEQIEREHILKILNQTGGVIEGPRGAAAVLALKPSTLRSRMKRLDIRRTGRSCE